MVLIASLFIAYLLLFAKQAQPSVDKKGFKMDIMMKMGFLTRSDINWAVQPQRVVRGLNFWIEAVEGLYNLCGK